jgi:hypothetical protein
METREVAVKSKGKFIGNAPYEVYATVAEMVENLGESVVLATAHAQIKTNAANQLRAEKAGKPTKKSFFNKAFNTFTSDEMVSFAGNVGAFQAAVEKRAADMEAEWAAEHGSTSKEEDTEETEAVAVA